MVKKVLALGLGAGILALVACNVEEAPPSTGGVDFDRDGGAERTIDDADPGDGGVVQACERGVVVVSSDYTSTNVSIATLDGVTKSASFVSSGSTKPGLSLALSGDVVAPSATPASGRVVLIDRYGKNVLTWMDVETALVLGQLPVGTGFESNPQDYLEVDASRAFVSRAGANAAPGAEPNDTGSDLLVVDFTTPAVVGSVVIPEEDDGLLSSPGGLTDLGATVAVSLGRVAADFSRYGDGRIVGVSKATRAIAWTVDVSGLKNCGKLALSPSKKLGAMSCAGAPDPVTNEYARGSSFVVIFDTSGDAPVELRRLGVGDAMHTAVQPNLAFANEDTLLALGYGQGDVPGDLVVSVDVASGAVTTIGTAGAPYTLGDVRCAPGCGDVCLVTDADKNVLRRWKVEAQSTFTAMADAVVDTTIGLPPRTLGGL